MASERFLWLCLVFLIGSSISLFAQEQEQERVVNEDQVIQIEAQILDTRAELPQVQILDKRKVSEFDEVKVEKSFKSELSGKSEEIEFKPITSGKIKPIRNMEELLNKKRF